MCSFVLSLSLSSRIKTNAGGQPLSHVSQQQLVPPPDIRHFRHAALA